MKREDLAFHIFLKRLPIEPLTDKSAAWVKSKAEESFELADVFLSAQKADKDKRKKHPVTAYTECLLGAAQANDE